MKHLDFYFDLSSPYSYLAATQLGALAAKHGATVAWKPMVLAAVFKAADNHMPAQSPPKARHMLTDLQRWAKQYGVGFTLNSRFPFNAIKPERLVIAAESTGRSGELALALFTAAWADDRDITSPEVMADVARAVGLDGDALLAAIETPAVKDRLKAYTDEAIALGVYGAPAMVVNGELFWGNDRLHHVDDALRDA
jgi:2-hydroxychromene-2-carboxylate isomerase